MTLRAVELASIAILAVFLWLIARHGLRAGGRSPRQALADIALIGAAAWVAEVSCIQLYGFYQYDAPWALFVGPMPLLVAVIWPFVILSGREVLHRLALLDAGGRVRAGAVLAIVLYDASLVEPIAVRAGLWSWNEPGLFGVPLIGILGWGFFAGAVSWLLDRLRGPVRLLVLVLAPLATHALLLATWWGALRWTLRAEVAPLAAAVGAIVAALALGAIVVRRGRRVELAVMAPRMLAAALFFALLLLRGRDIGPLVAYGLSFAGPYLLATAFPWSLERVPGPSRVRD